MMVYVKTSGSLFQRKAATPLDETPFHTFPNSFGQTTWNLRLHGEQDILEVMYRNAEFCILLKYVQ